MGLLSGREGESLFHEPLMRFFRHDPLPELLRKKAGITDDRHLAIVTALIVEHGVDALLGSFLPGYDSLAEKTEFTFSTKIGLVQAFAFIPPRILTAANMIRKIRNEFAHHLDMDSFSKLTPSLVNGLKNLRIDIYKQFGDEERKPKASLVDEYDAVAFFCIVGLDAYRENLTYLRSRIQKPEFIAALFEESMVENKSQLQAVVAEGPISVEIRDGNRIERYAAGLIHISADQDSFPEQSPNPKP